MFDEFLKLLISNGIFAVLFVFLFMYQIKDSNKREQKYINVIHILSNEVGIIKKVDGKVDVISSNVVSIKKLMQKKGV